MAKPTRYTKEMVEEYVEKGYWTKELTVDFWDRNAEQFPDEEAVIDSKVRLTWSQAKRQVNRIALGLLELGFKKNDVILAQLYNSVDLVLIRLACEKAGILLAMVPYTFRHAELKAVLKQVEAKGVVIPYEFRGFNYFEMLQEICPHAPALKYIFVIGDEVPQGAISLREIAQRTLEEKYPQDHIQATKFSPFESEEIMTTSGTTGIPKCVEWAGCARLAQGREYIKRLNLTHGDVIAAFSPSTGAATENLTYRCAPQVAAKTVMPEYFIPEEACRLIQRERITVAGIVPALIVRLVNYPDLHKYDLSSLRLLLSTAALLPYQVAREAEGKLGCCIVQGYGSMDTGGVTVNSIDETQEARFRTVGKPLTGNEVKLLDEEGREVPRGEVGMVTVSGPHCIGGYYKDPKATSEAWKEGWFAMGDLGKIDERGDLVIVGRKKDMILRGGQNIYPVEIENPLLTHPKVQEVAVVGMPDPVIGERACAYVVPKPREKFTFEEMVSFLRGKNIAPFKLPERLEIIDKLPLVSDQKVDKKALRKDIEGKLGLERRNTR